MLRISQQSSTAAAKRYYTTADYYAEGRETIGLWGGEGARRLGLEGTVGKAEFDRMCENVHPTRDGRLTARTSDDRTVGYDFTWSVPKSVSLRYALTQDEEILAAFRDSVRETMADIEAEMKTRVRKRGKAEDRLTGNMAWAEFVHFTGRPVNGVPDPQLHAHCFVFNACWDEREAAWKAGQFRDLKRDAPYWQAAFRVRLANRLQDLGYAIERTKDDFELAGVSKSVVRRFSRRTDTIERLADERGITDPARKAELGAITREAKDASLGWEQLRAEWASRLSGDEREALTRAPGTRDARADRPGSEVEAVDFAIRHAFERSSALPERKLLTEALRHGLGDVTVEGVRREYTRRPMIRAELNGQQMATTRDVLAEEERMIAFARDGRGRYRPLGSGTWNVTDARLNDAQRRAVAHVLGSKDRITIIRGAAGTGKSSMMQEAGRGIEAGGHRLFVVTPTASAARDAAGAGFASAATVAAFLRSEEMQRQAAGQVVWMDEAGLLGSKDMMALFDVADRIGARVILMGDRRQHASVARGSPLRLLEEHAGVPCAELTDILRQAGDYKRAVKHLSAGEVAAGFDELDRLGWVRQVDGDAREQAIANEYLRSVDGGANKTALVVSPTHAEAGRITDAIRSALREEGRLGGEREFTAWVPLHLTEAERGDARNYSPGDMVQFHQHAKGFKAGERVVVAGDAPPPVDHAARFQAYRPEVLALGTGDRVRVTANGKTKDGRHRLNNGDLFTVRGFTAGGDLIADNGYVIARDFGHLAQGYVVTSHASQGKTVDTVIVGQSSLSFPASGREQFYVSVSRGRERAVVFTDDKEGLRQVVRRADTRTAATDLVNRPLADPWARLRGHARHMQRFQAEWNQGRAVAKIERAREAVHER
jgi:conjugative relaxase-like TrwC/TraI family protein